MPSLLNGTNRNKNLFIQWEEKYTMRLKNNQLRFNKVSDFASINNNNDNSLLNDWVTTRFDGNVVEMLRNKV